MRLPRAAAPGQGKALCYASVPPRLQFTTLGIGDLNDAAGCRGVGHRLALHLGRHGGVRRRIEQRGVHAGAEAHDAAHRGGRRHRRRGADRRQSPELRDVVVRAVRHCCVAEHLDDVQRMVRRGGGGVVDRIDGVDDGLEVADEVVEADGARRQALRRQHGADRAAEVDGLRVRQDRGPRAGRARQRGRHDVGVQPQEHAADDAAERDADEVDAVAVEIGVRIAVGEIEARQRARQRNRVGDGLADVIARVERVADVQDLPAVVDLPVGREYARGADVVEIEVTLVVAERAVRALIERARRVRDAMQRQIDGDDGEPRLRERIGHREHHGAIQRDAVLEDHDGPARGRLRVAAAGVRQRREQRNAPVRHARDRASGSARSAGRATS